MILQAIDTARTIITTIILTGLVNATLIALLLGLYIYDTRFRVVLLLLLPSVCMADDWELPVVHPTKERQTQSETLTDIVSHLSDADYKNVQFDQHGHRVDLITVGHEGLHFLNAAIREKGCHAIYLTNDYAVQIPIPKCTIADVVENVPAIEQGKVFELYLINSQEWWNDDVIYLFDEAAAYVVGSRIREELGWTNRTETIRYAVELCNYCRIAVETIKKKDPEFDAKQLDEVLELLVSQLRLINPDLDDWPNGSKLISYGHTYATQE